MEEELRLLACCRRLRCCCWSEERPRLQHFYRVFPALERKRVRRKNVGLEVARRLELDGGDGQAIWEVFES